MSRNQSNDNEHIQRLMPYNGKIIYDTIKDGAVGSSRSAQVKSFTMAV